MSEQEEIIAYRAIINRINAIGRDYAYGQDELNDDLPGCILKIIDGLKSERDRLKHAIKDLEYDKAILKYVLDTSIYVKTVVSN
jgi:hypothetical protein